MTPQGLKSLSGVFILEATGEVRLRLPWLRWSLVLP